MINCERCVYSASNRWCDNYRDCKDCPLNRDDGCRCVYIQRTMDDCPYYKEVQDEE